ncbi:hypothetical protein [Yersinia ruckeri]|uniref:Uncharacterized protein n=1 Tax=Yersinia ruckeri TaxID=29486 RepID=A0A380SAE3_YERRU|nr:hypothetical protein [Yersinia ruckeri]KGA44867.1 hypothetical protein DJ39_3358 [Yersinia ruckeri ATCC 29473]MCK8596577.1 hypothetical protein [Yersinia ruckeri]MCK8599911.1 hypothetical protein [Yersinia ruckeri]MCW6612247.1 hypothetical protein [Yersinia ruckeri]MCW6618986.1 hypothetical protein [Yersinia ruckeri]
MPVNKVLVVKRLKEISGFSPCDSTERDSWELEANELLRLCGLKGIHIRTVVMLSRHKTTITPEESNLISWKSFIEALSRVITQMDKDVAVEKKYDNHK